jgi:hypothetical protein
MSVAEGTISTVGGLWSTAVLGTLRDEPGKLPHTAASDYGLPSGFDLRHQTRASWTLLKAAWVDFTMHHQARVEADREHYGSDAFTWDRWLRHLLGQLGYDQAETCPTGLVVEGGDAHDPGDRYRISRLWADRVPLLTLPAGVPLDRTTPVVPGAAKQSPHSTMQDYLNRTSRHLWGIATNGLTLRLLRDNAALTRQAYVEFDLATMFADDNYADFAVLWAAVHASRFAGPSAADCPAERWQQHATDTGVRALHTLREGVERAILELGQGLIEHPQNQALRDALTAGEIDGQEMYRQLLYVAYRHVFLFAVEDRGLLHEPDADPAAVARYRDHYSTARLRDQARRHAGGSHPDGWAAFQNVAAGLADPAGQPLLALPPMLGHLWSPTSTSHLNGTTLANRRYYAALRDLAFVQQEGVTHRIDYRNLGSDELGAVYESLLELTIDVSPTSRQFTKRRGAGSDRKTTGSYYTPTSLIARVLDDALEPVIARTIDGEHGTGAADALLALTICDPAMGSAHFLVAAAHRLAKQVAVHRTGSVEPDPDAYRQALRDVVSRCIYGVDLNPMAVELAKISLWLECHVPGQPLTFLDHHLKCGNALLGVGFDCSLIDWQPRGPDGGPERGGVPDAAFTAVHGDERPIVKSLKASNKTARAGAGGLLGAAEMHDFPLDTLAGESRGIAWMDDTTPEGLAAKQQAWMVYSDTGELQRERLKADAWTACWTIPATNDRIDQTDRPHDVFYDAHYNGMPSDTRPGVTATRQEAGRLRFFHWYLEFPEIADAGGFGCMLGNPPWERVKIQTEEWFANNGRDDIAKAGTAAKRGRMIDALFASEDTVDRDLARRWDDALQQAAAMSSFLRASGRYPLGGVGDVNLYAVFADHFLASHRPDGAAGFICPHGLAVGDTYSNFFGHLVKHGRLRSCWSFENEALLFPEITNKVKFALFTFDHGDPARPIGFTGWVRHAEEIDDPERRYELTAADIAAINPNTLTAALFRRSAHAQVTARIHAATPVLMADEGDNTNPWNVQFVRMFDMANDSGQFIEPDQATADGFVRKGQLWVHPDGRRLLPLYEGKMLWLYDHRYGTYEDQTQKQANKGVLPHTSGRQKSYPDFSLAHRYWVNATTVRDEYERRGWERDWVVGFRDAPMAERTFTPAVIPAVAIGGNAPSLLLHAPGDVVALFVATASSMVADFALRQKAFRMSLFVVKQAPVLPPDTAAQPFLDSTVLDFVAPRVAELVYTAHDVGGFAADIGYGGHPFRWDEDRRPVLQAELDAAMFHLYGLERDDVEAVLDSFTVLAKYERRPPEKGGHGEFRTKRLVLERYDAMVKATDTGGYACPLDVPPADDSMRHG